MHANAAAILFFTDKRDETQVKIVNDSRVASNGCAYLNLIAVRSMLHNMRTRERAGIVNGNDEKGFCDKRLNKTNVNNVRYNSICEIDYNKDIRQHSISYTKWLTNIEAKVLIEKNTQYERETMLSILSYSLKLGL